MFKLYLFCCLGILFTSTIFSQNYISSKKETNAFPIVSKTGASAIYTDSTDLRLIQIDLLNSDRLKNGIRKQLVVPLT